MQSLMEIGLLRTGLSVESLREAYAVLSIPSACYCPATEEEKMPSRIPDLNDQFKPELDPDEDDEELDDEEWDAEEYEPDEYPLEPAE